MNRKFRHNSLNTSAQLFDRCIRNPSAAIQTFHYYREGEEEQGGKKTHARVCVCAYIYTRRERRYLFEIASNTTKNASRKKSATNTSAIINNRRERSHIFITSV